MEAMLEFRRIIKPESTLKSNIPYFIFYKHVLFVLLTKSVCKHSDINKSKIMEPDLNAVQLIDLHL